MPPSAKRIFSFQSILMSFALVLTGCINVPHSSRGDPQIWGGYERDRVYILKRDVFVMSVDDGHTGNRLALVPGRDSGVPSGLGRLHSSPASVEAYHRDPVAASTIHLSTLTYSVQGAVFGIATSGTRLRPSRIVNNRALSLWYGFTHDITPFARILDGPLKGREVDIADVSDYYQVNGSGPFLYRPISLLLEAEQ